jgi:hypothetical protein
MNSPTARQQTTKQKVKTPQKKTKADTKPKLLCFRRPVRFIENKDDLSSAVDPTLVGYIESGDMTSEVDPALVISVKSVELRNLAKDKDAAVQEFGCAFATVHGITEVAHPHHPLQLDLTANPRFPPQHRTLQKGDRVLLWDHHCGHHGAAGGQAYRTYGWQSEPPRHYHDSGKWDVSSYMPHA